MNVFSLVIGAISLYRRRARQFILAGLALLLASLITFGWAAAVLIINGIVALAAGMPYGSWAKSPPHLVAVATITFAGLAIVSHFLFSLWGGFVNLCAKIGAGSANANLADFLGYGFRKSIGFWVMGGILAGATLAGTIPGILIAVFGAEVSGIFTYVGLVVAVVGGVLAGWPLAFSFAAEVTEEKGVARSMVASLRAFAHRPAAAIITLISLVLIAGAGIIFLPLYPIYLFLVYAPISAVLLVAHYQKMGKG